MVKRPSGGKQDCRMINLYFLVNRETCQNFFHVKISCFRVAGVCELLSWVPCPVVSATSVTE